MIFTIHFGEKNPIFGNIQLSIANPIKKVVGWLVPSSFPRHFTDSPIGRQKDAQLVKKWVKVHLHPRNTNECPLFKGTILAGNTSEPTIDFQGTC